MGAYKTLQKRCNQAVKLVHYKQKLCGLYAAPKGASFMRRSDRAITDFSDLLAVITACPVMRLGFADTNTDGVAVPYIVPLNFGVTANDDVITFYFHSALEGRKVELLKQHPHAAFEADRLLQVVEGAAPCDWSAYYESVMGTGLVEILEDMDEKKAAMDSIMRHYGYAETPHYHEGVFARTLLFKLTVTDIAGKCHRPKPE